VIVIGERINSTREEIARAIEARDAAFIKEAARVQVEAGAHFLDVNAGVFLAAEPEHLTWLVQTVQEAVDVPLSIDSARAEALAPALEAHRGRAMLNSISGERERLEKILPLVEKFRPTVIALCMDERGLPDSPQRTLEVAEKLVDALSSRGVEKAGIYLDPLVRPVGTDPEVGMLAFRSAMKIKEGLPGSKIICGLSNVSFGLPLRGLLNRNYLSMMVAAGIDAVIADPLDAGLMANLRASLALAGRDAHLRDYLKAFREGKLREG
jgi:5-methyltetrahydrofolate--homocysteine methyltransferase